MAMHHIKWEEAFVSPHLSKENLIARLDVQGSGFANVFSEMEAFEYQRFLDDNGYDATILVNNELTVGEGKYLLDICKRYSVEPTYAERMLDLAGETGEKLEEIFNNWINTGKVNRSELEYYLNDLDYKDFVPEVHQHFRGIYDSFREMEEKGLLK